MGVGANEMDESLFDERFGKVLRLGAKASRQTARGDLQQAPPFDQRAKHAGLHEDAMVAFGMRKDAGQLGRVKLGQQAIQRKIDFVGKFQQHVFAPVGQRNDFAGANLPHQIRLDSNIGARQHAQRDSPAFENRLEASGRLADRRPRVVGMVAQLVRRGDDGPNSILDGHLGHGQGIVQRGGAVVQPRQQMAMNIDKRFGCSHSSIHRVRVLSVSAAAFVDADVVKDSCSAAERFTGDVEGDS